MCYRICCINSYIVFLYKLIYHLVLLYLVASVPDPSSLVPGERISGYSASDYEVQDTMQTPTQETLPTGRMSDISVLRFFSRYHSKYPFSIQSFN